MLALAVTQYAQLKHPECETLRNTTTNQPTISPVHAANADRLTLFSGGDGGIGGIVSLLSTSSRVRVRVLEALNAPRVQTVRAYVRACVCVIDVCVIYLVPQHNTHNTQTDTLLRSLRQRRANPIRVNELHF